MPPLREELLSLLTEDDYDLAELTVQVPATRSELREAIDALLDERLAEWVVRAEDSGEVIPPSRAQEVRQDLSDDSVWCVPRGRPSRFLLRVTKAGWLAYFGHPPDPEDLRW